MTSNTGTNLNKAHQYQCNVRGCGGGECVHRQLDELCPYCGFPMVEVTTSGFRFCSNPDTIWGCDYEVEPQKPTFTGSGEEPCKSP